MLESEVEKEEVPLRLDRRDTRSLLIRHREGDKEAFALLIQLFRKPVFSYLVRCGVTESLRDDMFQEIFLKVHRSAYSYDPAQPLEPWLFTVVANTVRSHFRRKTKPSASIEEVQSLEDRTASAETRSELSETLSWLEKAIGALPLPQREALTLCCIRDLRQTEAAEALQIPLNTLKTRLRRAKASLAEAREIRLRALEKEVS